MIKTKIKRALALLALGALTATNFGSTTLAATQIGTGSVSGTGAFDSAIIWDDAFPGTASGSVSNIKIKARVNPTLNMRVSVEEIDLGVLVAGVASTGSLFLEVGTNAKSGVSITARSGSGGLTNTDDSAIFMNDNLGPITDDVAEVYNWSSTPNAADDSSSPAFLASGLAVVPVNDNSTEHVVYTTNKSETTSVLDDDVEFIVSVTSDAETPAGDYEDDVTFTVTGNF